MQKRYAISASWDVILRWPIRTAEDWHPEDLGNKMTVLVGIRPLELGEYLSL